MEWGLLLLLIVLAWCFSAKCSSKPDDDFMPDEVDESWTKSPEVEGDSVEAEFEYAYGKKGTATRTVIVDEVLWGGGRKYYLYGHCRELGGDRFFKTSRIRGKVSFEGKEYTPTAFMKYAFDIDNRYS